MADTVSEGGLKRLEEQAAAARRTAIRTTTDGILYQRKLLRQVRPGQSCGKVAGTKPLPSRQGVLLEP